MASSSNVPTMNLTHGEKPEKFNGNEFKRWQQKMLFYLTTLNLARFLHEECPILEEGETNKEKVAAVDAWKHSDFLCRNYVLNGLDNTLYNVYCSLKTAKELWDSLDKKYKTEDAGMKKFIVGKFLDFKMIDSKIVISQVQELQVILHEIHSKGMSLSDSFQVAAVIEKLPPLWKDFKNYLKHKRKEMNLEELIVRLRIEEDNRKSEKKRNNSMEAKANVIEQGPKTNKKRKHGDQNQNQGSNAAKKFKGKCYNCGKTGHKSNDCRKPKKEKKPQANVTEFDKLSNDVFEMNLSAVVSECNIVGNTKEWWVDTGATRHICSNKWMFSTYKLVEQNEELFMGNSSSSKVEGRGKVILKMTSGKELTLNDVLHMPDIRKNLVSGSLLSKNSFKLVFVSDKFVLTKNEMFVGKGYLSDGLFKMNVMTVVPKSINNNKIDSSAYLLESSNIWHVENQLSKKIKAIRSDRGGEYESPFEEFCLEHGIIHQTTAPYSPQSNGIAERKNRTLKEMMNAMLLSSGLPQNLWGEALLSANYILNKMPHKKTLKTPYDLWKENDPQTFKEAMSSPEASYWKEAINSEIESILQNHTWELVALPPGLKTSDGLILSQSHYIEKILEKFKKYDIRPRRHLWILMYVMNCTRPDIAYSVSKLSRFTNIQLYLKDTAMLIGYLTQKTQNPQVDMCLHLEVQPCLGNPQNNLYSSSTMESEFIAIDKAGEEAEWLRNFLEDIPNWSNLCLLFASIVIANQQLEEHRVITITDILNRNHLRSPLNDELICLSRISQSLAATDCPGWLDKQPAGSVIYVAFGSLAIFNQRQFNELALGLELVGRPFLWVVRSDFTDGSVAEYPDGFIERVADHGKIVSWAPQEEVLAHPSVAYQFHNQSYICKKWKVGLGLNPDEKGFISRHGIKMKIEKLVSDDGIKANAKKLKEMARKSRLYEVDRDVRKNGRYLVEREARNKGIRMEKTIPGTPQQNGVAERMNRTLNERARTYLINRGPTVPMEFRLPEEFGAGVKKIRRMNVNSQVDLSTPVAEVRRSSRNIRPPQRYSPVLNYLLLTDGGEPECYDEALQDENSSKWELAMKDEMDSLLGIRRGN
ncbi:Retrovirus-related Pol polyprotein from transposon TNT 1-94 [Vitis vinifera]|uniref:Retrovirus-related Pol polyprotein from transposon TNT 1-94 n=1 Tax=Vitis vinifera TaxID=29760 RepID=A0A438HFY7_VITVI|nr:Retrovirus-related Pol polyprotein from transposon TNT 1-94 [Vitis vinifera]